MRRFFLKNQQSLIPGSVVELPEGESRHISRVLRLTAGDRVELLDGDGTVYAAEIVQTGRIVSARIASVERHSEGGCRLVVGQGILKGKKMDTVIQKCTELGVNGFIPFASSRCQGKPGDLREDKRHSRYTRVVEAACKQCYRTDLMRVEKPLDYRELFRNAELGGESTRSCLKLLFWEEEREKTLHDIEFPEDLDQLWLLLGPEGGFTEEEVRVAELNGFVLVSLGPRILRAETATLSAVTIAQFLAGNM